MPDVTTSWPSRERLRRRVGASSGAAPEDARRANRSLLLRVLHHGGPASRATLAKVMGVTPATVSSVVKELLDRGVVKELGRTSGNVGKPATVVGIEPDGAHVIAVSLAAPDRFVGAIVNLAGEVVTVRTVAVDGRTGDAAAELVAELVDQLQADAARPLAGIGIASPGIVSDDGVVQRAARLGWTKFPLADRIAMHTGLPTSVANDANAAALAELVFGAAPTTSFLLVRVDQGVGAGLVLDGALYRGTRAAAGEIGHVVVDPDGAPCTCGRVGCLETVIEPALHADTLDAALTRRAGDQLGTALATVLSTLDLHDVVVSGAERATTDEFRGAVRDAIAARTMDEISDQLTVNRSSLGDHDIVLGAAALVLDAELGLR